MYIDLYSNQPPKKYYPTEIIVIHYCSICLGVVLIVIDYLHIPNDYVFTHIYIHILIWKKYVVSSHLHLFVCINIYIQTYTYKYTYKYTHTYTYRSIYIYTHLILFPVYKDRTSNIQCMTFTYSIYPRVDDCNIQIRIKYIMGICKKKYM